MAGKKSSNHFNLQGFFNSLHYDKFPTITKELVEVKIETNDANDEKCFDDEEITIISTDLQPFIKELRIKIENEEKNCVSDHLTNFVSVVKFVDYLIDHVNSEKNRVTDSLKQIVVDFNKLLRSKFDYEARNTICLLCEKCCQKNLNFGGPFITDTLYFLLSHTFDKNRNVTSKVLKRLMNMTDVIYKMNIEGSAFEQLNGKFLQTVETPAYLDCKEGQQFIAFLLTYDLKFTKKIHETIKSFLPDATKTQATAFGKIYYTAWFNTTGEKRQGIEKHCIQDLMSCIFTVKRASGFTEMSRLGKNVLSILSYLHESRKHVHLSKVITELYTPLIWRHLRSGNNIIRSNAAEVFLDVYPLEKPGSGRAEQGMLLQRQHDEMIDLLTDNCHVVRIIAVKGICNCLRNFWETFTPEGIQVLIKTMVTDLINDGSSADVRRAVYQGFSKMLKNPLSAAYLAKILPSLQNHIHDENEKVRRAFVEMLIEVKELPESFPLKYWKIVPVEHLAERLALENKHVGRPLVKLLMSEFYSSEKPMSAVLKRIYKIILMNSQAAKKLFTFSKDVLSVDAAVNIMANILIVMDKRLRELDEHNSENQPHRESNKKHKRARNALQEHNSIDENSSMDSSVSSKSSDDSTTNGRENIPPYEPHQLDNPDVCHVFIDIIIILWSVNSVKLYEEENEQVIGKLQNICASCVASFLRHFKGTSAYFAVIHLASLIPLSKLNPRSTISSACVSHLKGLSENSKKEDTEVYVNSLCAWNRGSEILELATDWLDQAFRLEGLNQSAAIRSSARQRKVKFQHCEAKPLLALQLLDIVFSNDVNRIHIISKNYTTAHDLFVFLERIKTLIQKRVFADAPFPDPQLSDEFLELCLYRYAKLIGILHKPATINDSASDISSSTNVTQNTENNQNQVFAPYAFSDLIDWATRVLIPKLPKEGEDAGESVPAVINFLMAIGKTGCLLMAANLTDNITTKGFTEFISTLLKSDCKLTFVEISFRALKELSEHAETHYERDEEKLLRLNLPNLFIDIISMLSEEKIKKHDFIANISDLNEIKRCFLSLPLALIRTFTIKSHALRNVICFIIKSCIKIIADNIQEDDGFIPVESIQSLPNCSSFIVNVLLSRENICLLCFGYLPEVIASIQTVPNQLLAVVNLLNTLSFVKKPNLKVELMKSVKKINDIFSSYVEDADKSMNISLNATLKESLDAKKLAIPLLTDIAERLGSTLT